MPTATTTITKAPFATQLPLKAGLKSSPLSSTPASPAAQSSTNATLRSLYNRAARAFVYRDIALTYSLLQSAFAILKPPKTAPDFLSEQRRKWDILRITLESTLYTSPPSSTEALPESLRSMLSESPQALATSIYTRSLSLFTPNSGITPKATSNAAYLPSPVLTTLVYSSLKIDAPDVGRVVIEDWLACREPNYSLEPQESEGDGYAKVLDLYCLQVLPKLEQWDYAKQFLDYECELPAHHRESLKTTLNNHYSQAMASRRSYNSTPALLSAPTSISPRSYSPAPSSSSSSSSLSTTSTHTIVPATARGNRSSISTLSKLPQASSSSTSVSSNETATPRAAHAPLIPNGNSRSPRQQSKSRSLSNTSSGYSSHPRSHLAHVSARTNPLSTYALIRASLAPYLTSARVTTFVLLFVLVPLLSFILRMKRRKRLLGLGGTTMVAATTSASNAELVRRRLQAAGGVEVGFLGKAWAEIIRAVGDTVKMAGSGLV